MPRGGVQAVGAYLMKCLKFWLFKLHCNSVLLFQKCKFRFELNLNVFFQNKGTVFVSNSKQFEGKKLHATDNCLPITCFECVQPIGW